MTSGGFIKGGGGGSVAIMKREAKTMLGLLVLCISLLTQHLLKNLVGSTTEICVSPYDVIIIYC